ncbi:MAG: DUF1269 domain-containing protein [Akkermansiaceae bacterium]|nr:DUF1269 domain-containing protein [Armatimonadota bacterium]
MQNLSIVGRDFQVREQIQGYYRPADAALEGAGEGAWFGGLFGMLMGFGLFLIPVAGMVLVLGPLSGLVAGAIAGAGVGALVEGLVALGLPRDQALRSVERLQAGQFLVLVQGTGDEVALARKILDSETPMVPEVAG